VTCSIAFILLGCASTEPANPHSGLFRGHYTHNFEVQRFQPCSSSERWWVSGDVRPLLAPLREGSGWRSGTVYVEVRGDLSGIGQYGHLGAYSRELVVHEVVTTRLPTDKDCQ
jgi:hypothetical protein